MQFAPAVQVSGPRFTGSLGRVEFDMVIGNERLPGDGRVTLEPAGFVDIETHEHGLS